MGQLAKKGLGIMGQPVMDEPKVMCPLVRQGIVMMGQLAGQEVKVMVPIDSSNNVHQSV